MAMSMRNAVDLRKQRSTRVTKDKLVILQLVACEDEKTKSGNAETCRNTVGPRCKREFSRENRLGATNL